jgi:hypothetical protein
MLTDTTASLHDADAHLPDETQGSAQAPSGGAPVEGSDEAGEPPTLEVAEVSDSAIDASREAAHQQFGQQLLDYLKRTEHVRPLPPGLIFLESGGHVFGLDLAYADQLQIDALNGRAKEVADSLNKLDPKAQVAGLRLLASLLAESSYGVELANVIDVLAAAAQSVDKTALDEIADVASDAVLSASRRTTVPASALSGLVRISRAVESATRDQLIGLVAGRPEAAEQPDLAAELLEASDVLEPPIRAALISIALCVEDSALRACAAMSRLPEVTAVSAFRDSRESFATRVAKADEAQTRFAGPVVAKAIARPLEVLIDERPALAKELAALALSPKTRPFRDVVEPHLTRLTPASSSLSLALLENVEPRAAKLWPRWLACVEPQALDGATLAPHVDRLATALWTKRAQDPASSPDDRRGALTALGRIARAASSERPQLFGVVAATLAVPSVTPETAQEVDDFLDFANVAVQQNVASAAALADAVCGYGESLLTQPPPAQPAGSWLVAHVEQVARWAEQGTPEVASKLNATATSCPWLPSPVRENVVLQTAAPAGRAAGTPAPYAADQVATLVAQYGEAFVPGLCAWLRAFAKTPLEAMPAVNPWITAGLPPELSDALAEFTARLTTQVLDDWALGLLSVDPGTASPSEQFLSAIGLASVSPRPLAERLIRLYQACTTIGQRETVIDYWNAANVEDEAARKELIVRVLAPLAASGKGGWRIAFRHLDLATDPPRGTMSVLQRAFVRKGISRHDRLRGEEALKGLEVTR